MKLRNHKKSLTGRRLTKQTKKYVELGKTPIIAVSITLADGAAVQTSGAAIHLLCKAVGEQAATSWHAKYMDRFDSLTKKCFDELENMVKQAKADKTQ